MRRRIMSIRRLPAAWVPPVLFLGALAILALPLESQEVRAARPVEIRMLQPRAQLGVLLGETVRVGDRFGVRVEEVSPGSTAERADIRAEDVILALDGSALGDEPGRGLVDRMADVTPGDTVRLLVHRGGQDLTVPVVTNRRAVVFGPGLEAGRIISEAIRGRPAIIFAGRHGLELVEMNPGLGRYFGTETGVLVANAPEDSPLGLQPGDVILSIDGRSVRDRAHVQSILASYRGDEEAEIRVQRDRRTLTLRATPGARR
jgi:S1-C subfamily serine protease